MEHSELINSTYQNLLFFVLISLSISSLAIGLSVFRINGRKNICRRIMLFSIYSCIWCLGNAWMGVSTSENMAYVSRTIAVYALHLWTANGPGLILDFDNADTPNRKKTIQDIFLNIIALIMATFVALPDNVTMTCTSYGVSYFMNITLARSVDFVFLLYCFTEVLVNSIKFYKKSKYKRNRMCMVYVIVAMATLPVGLLFDIVRPTLGEPSFPGSCFTAAIAMLFLYLAAYHLNVISISMKNIGEFLYKSVGTPTIILNEHGYILLANDFSMEYIGALEENVKGNRFTSYFNDSDNMIINYMNNLADSKKVFSYRSICKANQKMSGVEYSVVNDEYGEYLCTIAIIYDLTEEHTILKKLQKSREEALMASEAKSRFLANMSHEIRTPINAILGMNEMILRESENENVYEYSCNIQSAGRSLLSIVNDILDISKIESGMMEINTADFRLSNTLSDVMNLIKVRVEEKSLDFRVDINKDIPDYIESDETKLKQIITNLLSNAVKYTESGHIDFNVDYEQRDKETIVLKVSVSDTGIGIRESDMDKIFNSFKRVYDDRTRSIVGTGLGLNITKKIIELMDGNISVQSEYGKGSVFSVNVPVKILNREVIGNITDINSNNTNNRKLYEVSFTAPEGQILVVDDNEMNLAVVKGLLKKTKLVVDLIQSGVQCLDKITQKHYDVILLDHMMPYMDGIETFNKMKTLENNLCKDTPVIVLTANAVIGAREEYLKYGFTDYVSKPVEGNQLEAVLIKYMPKDKMTMCKRNVADVETTTNKNTMKQYLEDHGVNISKAVNYFNNDIGQFQDIIQIFYTYSQDKMNQLKDKLDNKELKEYAILIHALKGNAKNIGATELHRLAQEHETEAREGNRGFVNAHWDELVSEWKRVLLGIHEYLTFSQKDKEIAASKQQEVKLDRKIVLESFDEIREVIKNFDDVKAADLLENLMQYKLDEDLMKACKDCYKSVSNFNYTQAAQDLNIIM